MVKLELFGKCDLLIKNTAENEKYLNFDTILMGNFELQLKTSVFWVTTKTMKIFLHVFSFSALRRKAFSKQVEELINMHISSLQAKLPI